MHGNSHGVVKCWRGLIASSGTVSLEGMREHSRNVGLYQLSLVFIGWLALALVSFLCCEKVVKTPFHFQQITLVTLVVNARTLQFWF